MTKPLLDLDSYPTATDLVAAVIEDNAQRNTAGIPEKDIRICLEMSALCEWGSGYRPAMLGQALFELPPTQFKKSGDRWFHVGGQRLETFTRHLPEARTCDGPLCSKDITGARANARFCSPKCRLRASRRDQVPAARPA